MRKNLVIFACVAASLCCAQLMPADTPAKNITAEDSLKVLKVSAPVDYGTVVSTEDRPKGIRSRAMSLETVRPNKRDLFSAKNSLIATGTVFGMVVLAAMTGTTYIPPLNFARQVYGLDAIELLQVDSLAVPDAAKTIDANIE